MTELEINNLKKLADGGDAEACLKLGLIYLFYEGDDVPQDSKEAYKYFCQAEKHDNALAAYYEGLCRYYGYGVEVSDHRAYELFEEAAEKGVEEARNALSHLSFREHDLIVRANSGDNEACCILGESYHYCDNLYNRGLSVDEAYRRAVKWYEIAAERGDPRALHWLGEIYYFGWGVGYDKKKSAKYYYQAYESAKRALKKDRKSAYAKYWLGKCLVNGYGSKEDEKKGYALIAEAAEDGLREAQFEIVEEYDDQDEGFKDSPRIRKILEEAGEKGDAEDKFKVAAYYRTLNSCYDKVRAAYWYERSAKDGCVKAQIYLAEEYLEDADVAKRRAGYGDDVAENLTVAEEKYKKAFYWFNRAVKNGFIYARYDLARFYYEGVTVEKDYAKALEILSPLSGCTHGNSHYIWKGAAAAKMTGDIYLSGGYGVKRDLKKALTRYLSSVKHGCRKKLECMEAYTRIGDAYFYGYGTEQNYATAVSWYEEAVFDYQQEVYGGDGSVNYDYAANVKLGDCYRLGLGVEKDEEEAFRLYKDVTENTDEYAAANERVARCYYFGIGVEQDLSEAEYWWREAAELGDEDAKAALKEYFPEE